MRSFAQTTGCWLRGILWKDYGLDNSKVKWVTFEDAHIPEFKDPPGVERAAEGKDMTKMLLDGELDAAIFGTALPTDPRLKSVIPDPDAAAKEWYKKYGTVPLNHMVVVKNALSKSDPGAVREVFRMLNDSKKAAGLPKPGADRYAAVRLRRGEARARPDVELCAGDEDHPAALFGRGIVRRHDAGAVGYCHSESREAAIRNPYSSSVQSLRRS